MTKYPTGSHADRQETTDQLTDLLTDFVNDFCLHIAVG